MMVFDGYYTIEEEVNHHIIWQELPQEYKWLYEDELKEENPEYFERFKKEVLEHEPDYVPRD